MDIELKTDNRQSENEGGLSDAKGIQIICGITLGIVLGIILLICLIRLFVLGPYYKKKNRIDGKVVIITGCNTGIGKETALELAKRGGKIYMACRNSVKCETARLEIIEKSKNPNVLSRILDLSSLESIKKFVEKFLEEESRLDILINNAGIMAIPKGYTKDGFEEQFGVNHLGHFYLTNLLLDTLKASAPSRIVVVSSIVYLFARIKKEDLKSEKSYSRFGAYTQSKLANVLFTKHLSKMLAGTGVTVNCLHPGLINTRLSKHFISDFAQRILTPITAIFCKSLISGAQTTIRLAIDPSMKEITGHYYLDCYFRLPILPKGRDPQMSEWLWNISRELTGLSEPTANDTVVIEMYKPN